MNQSILALILIIFGGLGILIVLLSMGGFQMYTALKTETIRSLNFGKAVEVSVYIYDKEITGLEDIRGQHMKLYRDEGIITDSDSDSQIFSLCFSLTKDDARDMSKVIRAALEVKRLTDKTVLYFFKTPGPISIKTPRIKMIYKAMNSAFIKKQAVVMRVSESICDEDE